MKKKKKFWDNLDYNNIQLSRNFNLREFSCRGTGTVLIYIKLVPKLQKMRDVLGKSIKIHRGYSTPSYNKKVGGTRQSQHPKGRGVDVAVKGVPLKKVVQVADAVGFTGIIAYPKRHFVHLDLRTGRYVVVPKGWL